jgi:hypothetical protein
VEIVAQAQHARGIRGAGEGVDPPERFAAVVGEHLPGAGKPARLFKVKVGHQQRAFGRPEQRARRAIRVRQIRTVRTKGEP